MPKQFHIKDENGLYLTYKPSAELGLLNYESQLIEDYDFFPASNDEASNFIFKNSAYEDVGKIIGSNSLQKTNSSEKNSNFTKPGILIPGKTYYSSFTMYFRFFGSENLNVANPTTFKLKGLTPQQTIDYLNRLRIKIYAEIGSKLVSLEIDESTLKQFVIVGGNPSFNAPVTIPSSGNVVDGAFGLQVTTNDDGEYCIDMAYNDTISGVKNMFNRYSIAPEGYNFKVTVRFPDFLQNAKKTKNFKIIVKYYNLPAYGAITGYDEPEVVELMSENFTHNNPDLGKILIKQPMFDFMIKKDEFYLNRHGVSVTQSEKSFTYANNGYFHILNSNRTPIFFNGIYFSDVSMRKESAYSNTLINCKFKETVFDDNYVYDRYTVLFNGNDVGLLSIRRGLDYENGKNTILYPFQSLRLSATYLVLNLNRLDLHYYGKSNVNPDNTLGTIDFNFNVICFTDKQLTNTTTERITLTVNTINTGYTPLILLPEIDYDNIEAEIGGGPSSGGVD